MNKFVFQSEEDGYWYYWDDEGYCHGPYEAEDVAADYHERKISGVMIEDLTDPNESPDSL